MNGDHTGATGAFPSYSATMAGNMGFPDIPASGYGPLVVPPAPGGQEPGGATIRVEVHLGNVTVADGFHTARLEEYLREREFRERHRVIAAIESGIRTM